jgi:hypothetical protein
MKYQDLISSVARLGFESEIEDNIAYRAALRRSLYTLFTDRPVLARRVIVKKDHGTLPLVDHFTHDPRRTETFDLPKDGLAYSFTVWGEGSYLLTEGGITTEAEFSGESKTVKGFYRGDAEIRFFGDTSYTVTSLAAFRNIFSRRESDIPSKDEENILDLAKLIPDFLSPDEPPRNKHGEPIFGAEIEGDRLILPNGFSGEVHIAYKRKPTLPAGTSQSEDIDVPEECAELLPLLVASYIWLDDEPERSQYYLSLYKDGINTLRRFAQRQVSASYESNGWA